MAIWRVEAHPSPLVKEVEASSREDAIERAKATPNEWKKQPGSEWTFEVTEV